MTREQTQGRPTAHHLRLSGAPTAEDAHVEHVDAQVRGDAFSCAAQARFQQVEHLSRGHLRRTWGLGTRLVLAQSIVLIGAILTAGLIAAVVGPPLFHEHMLRAGLNPGSAQLRHVEEAQRIANLISLGIAIAIAAILAIAVSWYLTRRLQRPLHELTQAAAAVSSGDYGARVPPNRATPEFDRLADAFNSMADQLASTEDTRRRLLSDLAHELRTPVATLAAYLEGIEDGVTPWDAASQRTLSDQVDRLRRLADDLSAVSRAEEDQLGLQLAPVSVAELTIAATVAQHDAFAAKGVQLTSVGEGDPIVEGDRQRLLQVLTNLLDNALRHTPDGGSTTVTWQASREGGARIEVTDTGEGIAADQLPHVFERFYRGDGARTREQQGSGIGLTISQAIIRAHGGSLAAASPGPGRGSTFTLTLPGVR